MIRRTDEATVAVLDLDQAELALNPTRTRVWAAIGVPWIVETPGNNRKQVAFGAVNSRTGQTHFALREHKRSTDFQTFVDQQIIPAYPEAKWLLLIVDGASIYNSKSTKAWLAQHPQVILVPLPTYAPKLNLQEHIWRWMRREVTHNHFYGSLAALVAAAQRFFDRVATQRVAVLRRIGRPLPENLLEHYFAEIP